MVTGNSAGFGGSQRPKLKKKRCEGKLEFLERWGVQSKNIHGGGMDIFFGTTQW